MWGARSTWCRIGIVVAAAAAAAGVVALIVLLVHAQSSTTNNAEYPQNAVNSQVNKRMIGYYAQTIGSPTNCSLGATALQPDTVPANLYTHLVYGFSPPISTTTWQLEQPHENEAARYVAFNALKAKNPNLKTMLSVGGDLPSTAPMSSMASDPGRRAIFVNSTMRFIRKYGFDGIDIDWEFPTEVARGGSPNDNNNFVALVADLRQAIEMEAVPKNSSKLLLSCIVPGGPFWGKYYNISDVISHLDWVNILGYNVLGTWMNQTECSAPLQNPLDRAGDSVANAIQYFVGQGKAGGADASKFNLGVSFWGIAYTLASPIAPGATSPGMNAPAFNGVQAPAKTGQCTHQPGYLAYFESQAIMQKNNLTGTLDPVSQCKYFTYDTNQWVAFEDGATLSAKIDYAMSMGIPGVSIWGLDADIPKTHTLSAAVNAHLFGH
ncbi:unnamed protein product (mitochondrion) [Plasmodiophora brassicae]|uniref:GH18 domain-containing protein n=1 Tax=Plasmodiophora brassicae TaxID=37360 RepID=A0A3P3Y2H6_PLABS|nr:GH18 chitinase [Plasmodiophora brassicae]SPQ94373.1 unnamed protein product [Plasmodiophora brassicae]